MKKYILILLGYISIAVLAQERITWSRMPFVEMTKQQVEQEIGGNYYVYSPPVDLHGIAGYDPDDGTLGMTITPAELSLVHNFAQKVHPGKGSGNITGTITDHADYSNGKWFKYCGKDQARFYFYTYYEFSVEYMKFENTRYLGNSITHKDKLKTPDVGIALFCDSSNVWWYFGKSGKYRFKKYGAEEIAQIERQKKAEELKRQKEEEERKIRAAQEEERRRQEAEEKKRLQELKRQQQREQQQREEERKREFARQKEEALKHQQLVNEGIQNGFVQGHECVDLGFSVAWATCNVGASSPKKKGTVVKGQSAIVSSDWKGDWRLPTWAECNELKRNCTFQEVGFPVPIYIKVTSKSNGKSIILPAYTRLWTSMGPFYWDAKDTRSMNEPAYSSYDVVMRCVISKY